VIDKNKVAILITAHCNTGDRTFMTEKICEKFSKSGYYVCLAAHTQVSPNTLNFCNAFIYDSDNSMELDGRYQQTRNGPPEVRSVQDSLDFLANKGFTHVFKTTYDISPLVDVDKVIQTHGSSGKKLVAMTDNNHCATMAYFGEIDFIKKTYNYDMLRNHGFNMIVEYAWRQQIVDMGLWDEVSQEYSTDSKLLLIDGERAHYSHIDAAVYIDEYKSKLNG
jgi:hypothetical protein